ncbi:thiazole tautomerase TenI [Chengkuizengella axinellae]|uniref:Thiazole tautomerase TenI n=1 Tax=Chengkuizengella axinellae TaxID=3064388 RepID=A0ABT9IZF7_9BACL|nr:thiazole tautomerase TenI [Chengkuizengella sp. 2205SS18-9]MDP5274756.1 thiazole tautomerase TenI [Chengkuizengella sp. 2205SS18-9]
MLDRQLHLISNGKLSLQRFAEIAGQIHSYVTAIHIREKQKSARELMSGVTLLEEQGVPLSKIVINDRVDVAVVSRVSSVQLAYHSLDAQLVKRTFPNIRIGCSVHSLEEALSMEQKQVDYVFYGHVYETDSKPGLPGRGLRELEVITQKLQIPVIAIGGIKPSNIKEVLNAGASGIAVMSGLLEAENPLEAVRQYHHLLK